MADKESARAILRITAVADSGLQRALRGTVREAGKASKDIAASASKSAAQQKREADGVAANSERMSARAARAAEREARRSTAQQKREAEDLEKFKAKAAEQGARTQLALNARMSREREKNLRAQIQDVQKAEREQLSSRKRLSGGVVAGAAVAGGVVGAVVGRVKSYAGAMGMRSQEQLFMDAITQRKRMGLLADQAGMDPTEAVNAGKEVNRVAASTGIDQSSLMDALQLAHDDFTAAKSFAPYLEQIAKTSVATGADPQDLVKVLGEGLRQFGISADKIPEMLGSLVQASDLGSMNLKDVAALGSPSLAAMGRDANMKGMEGFNTGLGLLQVIKTGGAKSDTVATQARALVESLNKDETRKALSAPVSQGGFGVNVLNKDGTLRSIPSIAQDLGDAGYMDPKNAAKRQNAFTTDESRNAMGVLVKQFNERPMESAALIAPESAVGTALTDRRAKGMLTGENGTVATLATRQLASYMDGDNAGFSKAIADSASQLSQLTAKYPKTTEAIGALGSAAETVAKLMMARALMMGGANAVAGAGTIAAGTATAAGVAGTAVGGTAAMAAGAVAAGAAGYLATDALMGERQLRQGVKYYEQYHSQDRYSRADHKGINAADKAAANAPQKLEVALKVDSSGNARVTSVKTTNADHINVTDSGFMSVSP